MNKSILLRHFLKNFFTIRQVVQSCGLSRATILRLEEKGPLKPAQIDLNRGYHYYDNHNRGFLMQLFEAKAFSELTRTAGGLFLLASQYKKAHPFWRA